MRAWRKALLGIGATVGFGLPALPLFLGLPLLAIAVFSLGAIAEGAPFAAESVSMLLWYPCGILGLLGAVSLTQSAMRPSRPLAHPLRTLVFACLGVFALSGAVSTFDLNRASLLAPVAATLHFLYLAKSDYRTGSGTAPGSALSQVAVPIAIILIAVIAISYRPENQTDPRAAIARARTEEQDPCMRWFRDGNRPKSNFELGIREQQWPQFAATMRRFSQQHQFELHDGTPLFPDSANMLELLALSREHDPTDHRRRLEQLADRLKGHEELLGIDLEVRPTEGVTRVETLYSPAPAGSSNCVMRSVAANRSGLIRCRARGTGLAIFDYLRVTRPIQRDTQATVLAILRLDYHKLRQRLRKNSAGAGATLRG